MNKTFLLLSSALALMVGCANEPDPFVIQKQNIGRLNDSTQMKDLKEIFSNDSIAGYIGKDEFTVNMNQTEIFGKDGNPLLIIYPKYRADSTSVVSSVRILDQRYKTEKGISPLSTFGDIENKYTITKIDNLIGSINVNIKEMDAVFTIDKKELPANLRFDRSITIEPSQIPSKAKIKYFFLHWN